MRTLSLLLGCASALLCQPAAHAEDIPLHVQVDQLLAARPDYLKNAAPRCSDEEFLRRVYLDLTGCIPSSLEAHRFLDDKSAHKRVKLIDRLLASPEYARHLSVVFEVMLMERRPDKYITGGAFREYLCTAFAANRPWDEVAREILSNDGTDPNTRASARFFLDRAGEPNVITKDVSRLFLGRNIQCAQCHDHPLIDDYKQSEYYGLFAFVNRIMLINDPTLKAFVLSEKAEGEANYQSVFDPAKVTKLARPQVLGRIPVKEPMFEKGKEYKVLPAKNVRAIPNFSRLAKLGAEVARADNPAFCRNYANRLWALLMGRGLIHPLDLEHTGNTASHPELLDLLTRQVIASKFDTRAFLRELALSDAYQRSSVVPEGVEEAEASFAVFHIKPLAPEALGASLIQATGITDVERAALGAKATEEALYARLSRQYAPLVSTFAGQVGREEEYVPTLDQALFFANGPLLQTWLAPRPGNLLERASKLKEPDAIAEEMYLSVLTRYPTRDERREVTEYLARPGVYYSTPPVG